MVFKLKLKDKEIKEYTQILTIFTADNEDTGGEASNRCNKWQK